MSATDDCVILYRAAKLLGEHRRTLAEAVRELYGAPDVETGMRSVDLTAALLGTLAGMLTRESAEGSNETH